MSALKKRFRIYYVLGLVESSCCLELLIKIMAILFFLHSVTSDDETALTSKISLSKFSKSLSSHAMLQNLSQSMGNNPGADIPYSSISLQTPYVLKGIFMDTIHHDSYAVIDEPGQIEKLYQINERLPDGSIIKDISANSMTTENATGQHKINLRPGF